MSDATPELPSEAICGNVEGRSFWDALTTLNPAVRIWSDLGLLTTFWLYVALTNVLWGTSMQTSLASIGVTHVFASWDARLVQHLILYPALIGCMWMSRRIGWQPVWRAVPLQVVCGLAFSTLANPVMDVSEKLVGMPSWHLIGPAPSATDDQHGGYPGQPAFLWLASVANFLINYAFCLALLAGFEFYRRYRDSQVRSEALERSLSAAHLAALRMQLSPHTFFNLLHTIRGHVAWDPDVAQSMIVQLGDLLRCALQAGEHELSRLHDELEFVRLYLQLQQRRFADRLIVVFPDPEASPAAWVPSLILQPLVENAVVHGLADPQSTVTVRVEIVADGETLVLRVTNSLASEGARTSTEQTGIGLKNVRERLAIQFSGRAALRAGPGHANDWIAEIRIPLLHSGA
jgi:hypothetical protein